MELHEIRYFLAISETLNFTRAAERCNVSQPALTRAIRNLEDKLGGGPLIHRERGKSHLTELGRIMLPYFERVYGQLQEAAKRAKDFTQLNEGELRVGLMSTIGPNCLSYFIAEFVERHPRVKVSLQDGSVNEIKQALERGELDAAIFCRPEPLDNKVHSLPLFEERFVVALPPNHPLTKLQQITMRDLDGEHYLGRAHCEYYERLRDIRMRLGGIEFVIRHTSNRDDWIQSMVMAGLGFTYIPEFAVTMPNLVTRPLVEPEVLRTIQLVTVRGRPHSPAVGAFVREARRHSWQGKVEMMQPI